MANGSKDPPNGPGAARRVAGCWYDASEGEHSTYVLCEDFNTTLGLSDRIDPFSSRSGELFAEVKCLTDQFFCSVASASFWRFRMVSTIVRGGF